MKSQLKRGVAPLSFDRAVVQTPQLHDDAQHDDSQKTQCYCVELVHLVPVKETLGINTHTLDPERPTKFVGSRKFEVDIFEKPQCYTRVGVRTSPAV